MLLVDSHCHLDRLSYGSKQTNMADVLAKAAEQDVGYFLCVSVTQAQFPTMLEAIAPYPQVFASCGVHPLNQEPGVDAALLLTQAADERVVAIGETGLDYFYSPENKEVQQASFREHIRVARALMTGIPNSQCELLASDEMLRSVSATTYGEHFEQVRQRLNISCKPGERFLFFYGDRLETNGLGRVFLAHCAMHEDNPFSYCDNYFYYSWKP